MEEGHTITQDMLRDSPEERARLAQFVVPFRGMYSFTSAQDAVPRIDNQGKSEG
jgi:hypothetical protein